MKTYSLVRQRSPKHPEELVCCFEAMSRGEAIRLGRQRSAIIINDDGLAFLSGAKDSCAMTADCGWLFVVRESSEDIPPDVLESVLCGTDRDMTSTE